MRHVLELDEILLNIFGHYNTHRSENEKYLRPLVDTADFTALARICRIFKEPALDILWSELFNLSPLARWLPEASYQLAPGPGPKVRSRWFSSRVSFVINIFLACYKVVFISQTARTS